MLSQITSRLMMGSSSNTSNGSSSRGSNNNNNNNSRDKPTFASGVAPRSAAGVGNHNKPSYSTSLQSGYSADGSSSAVAAARTAPPDYIDFLERHGIGGSNNKDDGGSNKPKRSKDDNHQGDDDDDDDNHTSCQSRNRRKAMELSFTASRAMEDLKKGGLPIPIIRTDEAERNLDGHKIDVSKVELVMAKSVKESPFLIDNQYNTTKEIMKMIPDIASEYSNLFAATYHCYESSNAATTTTTASTTAATTTGVSSSQWGGDSSTSSVTSSEGDDAASMPPPALVIPPLLEDALKANEEAMKIAAAANASANASTDPRLLLSNNSNNNKRKRPLLSSDVVIAAKAAKLHHITMNDALEASNEARVVTLSFHPFIVVHVNTAYTRLTGYSSAKVLGKPLQDCLSGSCSKEWMKLPRGEVPHPVAALHEQVIPIRTKVNKRHHQQCQCRAILVGQQLEDDCGSGGGKNNQHHQVDTSSVTHYAVSFLPMTNNRSTTTTSGTNGADATVKTTTTTTTTTFARAPSDRPQQVMG